MASFHYLLHRFWVVAAWCGVMFLLYLSLTPEPPEIPIDQGDKLGHALAYMTLMYWSCQVLPALRQRLALALGLIALGIAIEYVQRWTGWRNFDYMDMLADAVGVIAGGILAATTPNMPQLLMRIKKRQRL